MLPACFLGIFLEQAQKYRPELIRLVCDLLDSGSDRVELPDTTYYNSLAGFFSDPHKNEFRDQLSFYREQKKTLFGTRARTLVNTALIVDRELIALAAEMGYCAVLGDPPALMDAVDGSIYAPPGEQPKVILRSLGLSLDLLKSSSALSFAESLAGLGKDALVLGFSAELMDLENRLTFWTEFPENLNNAGIEFSTPDKIADFYKHSELPTSDFPETGFPELLLDQTQQDLFIDIERLESVARKSGGELLANWRYLTAADHLFYMGGGARTAIYSWQNPYGDSCSAPTHILTRKIDDLGTAIQRFTILKKSERTAVLIISPETGKLPEEMGQLARYISGKSGGQGEVVSALCEGLTERGIEVHIATLNLKKRFRRESRMSEEEWRSIRYKTYADYIHLVSSAVFADNMSAYSGNPLLTAAEFQREIINNTIKEVRAKCRGKLIVHTHDWMSGGPITAYAKVTGLPILHTVHNVFTGNVPLDMYFGVDLDSMNYDLYFSEEYGRKCIDCQATAIKDASLINFVGHKFLNEVVNDYFLDRHIIPTSVRHEVKMKYFNNAALAILNAPSPNMYPENCPYLVRRYGPEDDFLQAKAENKMEFQRRTGLKVNPQAILFFWPSRLDPSQKGVELLEDIALKFVIEHGDVQIGIVADGVGTDRTHVDILGRIAVASNGQIAIQPFGEDLAMLGFAAASDVFGASLYEPCGQIDQIGNLFGGTATNRDTGGYHDKIREMGLRATGLSTGCGKRLPFSRLRLRRPLVRLAQQCHFPQNAHRTKGAAA